MKIVHHFTTQDPTERFRRQTAIYRRCLLLLRGQGSQAVVLYTNTLPKAE